MGISPKPANLVAIIVSIWQPPNIFFQDIFCLNIADLCILRNKDIFIDSSSYFIVTMYTIVAQKVTQCFRKYKKPDKRSENPSQHTACLFISSNPQFIDENGKKYRFSKAYLGVKYTATPFTI